MHQRDVVGLTLHSGGSSGFGWERGEFAKALWRGGCRDQHESAEAMCNRRDTTSSRVRRAGVGGACSQGHGEHVQGGCEAQLCTRPYRGWWVGVKGVECITARAGHVRWPWPAILRSFRCAAGMRGTNKLSMDVRM